MIIKFTVYVKTRYVGSQVDEELELEVDDTATAEEIEKYKEELANEWLWENIEFGF